MLQGGLIFKRNPCLTSCENPFLKFQYILSDLQPWQFINSAIFCLVSVVMTNSLFHKPSFASCRLRPVLHCIENRLYWVLAYAKHRDYLTIFNLNKNLMEITHINRVVKFLHISLHTNGHFMA